MNKKRILIASVSFYPRISPRSLRATELAKEFARQGHKVTVLTDISDYCYKMFEKKHNLKVQGFVYDYFKKDIKKGTFSRIWRFLLKYFFLYPDIQLTPLLNKELLNRKGYDLLISIAVPYPVHWGVALARKKNKELCKTWVADCGDAFVGYGTGYGKPFYFNYIHNWFMKNANYITLPYEELKMYFKNKYHDKIYYIPQGLDFSQIQLACYKENSVPTFAYAGAFIKNFRDPRLFLEYLIKINSEFKFIIYTKNEALLAHYKKYLKHKLIIRNYIPRNQLIYEMSKMDFLINIQNGNKNDYPSKLIDYSLSRRPILQINSFALDKKTIDEFFKGDYSNSIAYKDISKFDVENVTRQFIDLCKS